MKDGRRNFPSPVVHSVRPLQCGLSPWHFAATSPFELRAWRHAELARAHHPGLRVVRLFRVLELLELPEQRDGIRRRRAVEQVGARSTAAAPSYRRGATG